MILQSKKERDSKFVSKVIDEYKLSQTPIAGFHNEDDYWQENSRYLRVVERYEWGAVMRLANRETGDHSTMVLVGTIDLESGTVVKSGRHQTIPVPWYGELAEDLKDVKSGEKIDIAPCIGWHESIAVCDGGLNPDTNEIEPPCAQKSMCIALQEHAYTIGVNHEELLKGKSPEEIVRFTGGLVKKDTPSQPVPKRKLGKGTPQERTILDLAEDLSRNMNVGLAESKESALDGEMFIVNRITASGYISLYIRRTKGRSTALASYRFMSRSGKWKVQLPIPPDHELLGGIVESDIQKRASGCFLSLVKDVDRDSTRWTHVQRIIEHLIANDRG